jgi:aspartate beta-hydroxylase
VLARAKRARQAGRRVESFIMTRVVQRDEEQPLDSDAVVDFLRAEGAAGFRHAGGRTLLDHLVGTSRIVRCWQQPLWLQCAALIHSVYGTDAYPNAAVSLSRRTEVAEVAGAQAERLAYLFCVTPRGPLLAGTHRWARDLPSRSIQPVPDAPEDPPTRAELDALVLIHMANLAEQARAADGSPGRWLVRIREVAELLEDSDSVTLPLLFAQLAALSKADEATVCAAYRDAVGRGDDLEARASRFALAASVCPAVPEPCVWLGALSHWRGDDVSARSWAAHARRQLLELGTPWDKRLTSDEWLAIIDALADRPAGQPQTSPSANAVDPRGLFALLVGSTDTARAWIPTAPRIRPPDAATGRQRFDRYIETLAGADGTERGAIYPDLPSRPWHDPEDFPLVAYLESNYLAIRDEILALNDVRFHRESEGIKRTGDWDVMFLYERGRRHAEVCDLCPVTSRGIEAYPTIRTAAGLIYVSRMRGSTHIAAHRGPTNVRLRCHLAVEVPDGDCAIRVGGETRQWQEGKCLLFDDYYDHEAWNHTDESRIVLIVDMWHPGLSATEVLLLEGLQNYASAYARRLNRYWASNEAAVRNVSESKVR